MSDLPCLAERFLRAFYGGDRASARAFLAGDFVFHGPGAVFSGADQFLASSAHVAPNVRALEVHKVFADDTETCLIYDVLLDHRVNVLSAAHRFRSENGKIAEAWMYFDTAPFMRSESGAADEREIDPVCGMTVDANAPAATRMRDGKTYYFCSAGCAEAFG